MKNLIKSTVVFSLFLITMLTSNDVFAGCTAPPAPTNLSIVRNDCGSVTVSWANGGGSTTNFYVYFCTSQWAGCLALGAPTLVATTVTTRTWTGLAANTTYYVRIRAYNSNNGGCFGGEVTGSINTGACCVADCNNGVQDCDETGIDCGGSTCPVCASTDPCENGIQDGTETGVDCGGSCPPCGTVTNCASDITTTQSGIPGDGIIDLTGGGTAVINSCITYKYSNAGSNWVHGTFIPTNTIGYVSVAGSGTPPAAISSMGTTYTWTFNAAPNFTSSNSGQTVTSGGYYVETAATFNPGNNLGYPRGAGTDIGPFCFNTTLSCAGAGAGPGDNAGVLRFGITSDSYSGSWTNNSCQIQLTSGAAAYNYTLRCPVDLPVALISFDAIRLKDRIDVVWKTASERDIDKYIVEKSYDGYIYNEFKRLDGPVSGNSTNENSYLIEDFDDVDKNIYYRLKEIDFNGNVRDISIAFLPADYVNDEISISPNPVEDFAEILFYSTVKFDSKIRIFDISGKLIENVDFSVLNGSNKYILNTTDYKKGLYIVEVNTLNKIKQIKFIK
jgi:hypothetical protein